MMARRVMASSKRLWTPREITTSLWFDAADSGTITKDGSNLVSQWSDKSGNNYHATQSTSGAKPTHTANGLNGKSVVTFGGSHALLLGDILDSIFSGAGNKFHIFVVAKNNTADTSGIIISKLGDSNIPEDQRQFTYRFLKSSVATIDCYDFAVDYGLDSYNYTIIRSSTSWNANAFGISCVSYDGATGSGSANSTVRVKHYVNGSSQTEVCWSYAGNFSDMRNGTAQVAIGAAVGAMGTKILYGLTGAIAELLVLPVIASIENRQRLDGYFAHKWGLTANLPADHPYKFATPRV